MYLPHPEMALWVEAFIEEAAVFPNGPHDDQVDATTQALLRFTKRAQGGCYPPPDCRGRREWAY